MMYLFNYVLVSYAMVFLVGVCTQRVKEKASVLILLFAPVSFILLFIAALDDGISKSDQMSRMREKAEAAREEAERAEKGRLSRADVLKPRYVDPLAELEATIRKWCMHRGVDEEGEWFRVTIESGYKKKVLKVEMLINRAALTPNVSYFGGETTEEMFREALMFYRKGCEV